MVQEVIPNNNSCDRTKRPNVTRFLPYWKDRIRIMGVDHVHMELNKGKTTILTRKDRTGLMQALGLR